MTLYERLLFLHRAWRYRLNTEKFGMSFLMSRDLKGKTAVDIGADSGIYSYWMHKKVGRTGHVIAFEPQPELCVQLKEMCECFRLGRVELAQVGLSSTNGELTLRRPKTFWRGASFEVDFKGRGEDRTELDLITARVMTADSYFKDHSARPISFIKCDVEGHEEQVFRGSRQILTDDRPDLLFECFEAANPQCGVFTFLKSLDYVGFCFYKGGFAPIEKYASLLPKLHKKALSDVVFVPKERSMFPKN